MAAATQRNPRVNDVVTYYRATSRKPVPAVVTAVTAPNTIDLRIGHSETHAAVLFRTAHSQTGVWDWR